MHRTMLMTLYATRLRRAELCHLKVSDIDSERMVIHVHGKGSHERDALLTPKLLETLREYWRWMKPKTFLLPGTVKNWRADVPITEKIVWDAVAHAAKHAGIKKHVSPHTLIVSPHTFSKPAPTCALSRYCSAMPRSAIRRSTYICHVAICTRSPVRWKQSRFRVPAK